MPAEKQSALVGFSIDATVFFFFFCSLIKFHVTLSVGTLDGRDDCHNRRGGGDISGGLNSLTAHV